MFTRRSFLGIGMAGVSAGLGVGLAGCATTQPGGEGWNSGNRIPDIALQTADGATVRLSDYSDRALLFYIGGEWCVYCRQGMPALADAWRSLRQDPRIAFVAMSYAEAPETTRRWINDKTGIGMTVLHPPSRGSRVPLVNGSNTSFVSPTVYILTAGNIIHTWRTGASSAGFYRTSLLEAAAALPPRA